MYSDKVREHFMCPQNAHSMPDADAVGVFGDPACGDSLKLYIKVRDNRIEDISYLVFGCCASIATSSMTSVLAKGRTLDKAMEITEEDIVEALDGLPEHKKHCSNLGVTALRNAIKNYNEKANLQNNQNIPMNFMDIIRKMMVENYGEIIVEHLDNPRNHEVLEDADGYASHEGTCEDTMRIWIKVIDNTIEKISFRSDGCEITRAVGSMLTELVKGMDISEALKITPWQINAALGGKVPENHFHSLVLAKDTLCEAIQNYKEK